VAEREASGEFDYLIGDRPDAETPGGAVGDMRDADDLADLAAPQELDPSWDPWRADARGDGSFDAFDASTWYFEPAPVPWYQRGQARVALIATAAAAVAIVVSVVLLVVRAPSPVESTTSVTPTAPTSVASASPSPSSAEPPAPPPPPPETSAPAAPPPVQTVEPRTPHSTKEPEIGVTRTPVTRSQLSVAPPRPPRRTAP
jgi:hypothetical protein